MMQSRHINRFKHANITGLHCRISKHHNISGEHECFIGKDRFHVIHLGWLKEYLARVKGTCFVHDSERTSSNGWRKRKTFFLFDVLTQTIEHGMLENGFQKRLFKNGNLTVVDILPTNNRLTELTKK